MPTPRIPGTSSGGIKPAPDTESMSADKVLLSKLPSLPSGVLRRGDKGDSVKALQKALNALGADLVVDGIFGPATEAAVRAAQRSAGISQDGIYGPNTREAMSSGARVEGGGTATNTSSSSGGGGGMTTGGGGGAPSPSSPSGGSTSGGGPGDRLPGGYEVWKINGVLHVVYQVEGAAAPLAWRVDAEDPGLVLSSTSPSRTLTGKQAASMGVLVMGKTRDLRVEGEDPLETFLDELEERLVVEPWLSDPEVLAQAAEAFLEGRSISISDLKETQWYNTSTQKQRDWIAQSAQMSTEDVKRAREDRRIEIRNLLLQSGISDPPPQLVNFIAERDLTGVWSDVKLAQQITALSDPYSGIDLDPDLAKAVKGVDLVTKAEDVRQVKEIVEQWLGPFADSYTDRQYEEWAGMLRNDPNGQVKLEEMLRGQRMALLPEHANPDLKWADIAAPWRAYASQQWGEEIDETDPVLLDVIKANDVNEAGRLLRREGMKRGIGGVTNQVTEALTGAFGGSVRRSL